MQTYSDYYNDAGLAFEITTPFASHLDLWLAIDCGGSEIYFRCNDLQVLEQIKKDINSSEQCGPTDDGSGGSSTGMVAFWDHVDRCLCKHLGAANVWYALGPALLSR